LRRQIKLQEKALDFKSISVFLNCPYLYNHYRKGNRDLSDATHRVRGLAIHGIFGGLLENPNLTEDALHTVVGYHVDRALANNAGCTFDRYKATTILHDQIATSYLNFLSLIKEFPDFKRLNEQYLCITLDGWEIFETLDYLFLDKFSKKAVLVDGTGTLNIKEKQDSDKLLFCNVLFQENYGFPLTEMGHFYFQSGEYDTIRKVQYTKTDIGKQLGFIRAGKFNLPPVKTPICYFCPLGKTCVVNNKRKRKSKYYIPHDPNNNEVSL